ncbi:MULTISPECIES: serine/threonine-protein kinase [unclassified Actinopolyspora]|uniref:protein kinase domain-containing protein n=1 Tax=unclassified Actinopolyspora TaxID=2639451 RepID=UPI0013F5D825|nr:serine/threonine protein kinase [Actinopolyspora sp. BKK2]NHE76811.1 serine/threonine protein kinase [Actinopolyspora sp. BKK1]
MQPLLAGDPDKIGDYRLLARIGKGAMGAVYLGVSRGGRPVAVKVAKPELAEDSEFRERFRREASMSAAVGGFWTATVVDSDPESAHPWLATEYVPGPTLHQAVAEHGPLPESTVLGLGAGLAEALQAVHRAGLVHRDLKPANVLLGPDGPRVIDFGISRAMAATGMTATGMFFGTPGFFSPEQTTGSEVAPPSDVFSLGAVLAFAATGAAPFGNENTAAMLYRVVHNEPDLSALPEAVRSPVAACLAKDPNARPSTGELLDTLGNSERFSAEWLPADVKALINGHTAQLERVLHGQAPDHEQPPARREGAGGTAVAPASATVTGPGPDSGHGPSVRAPQSPSAAGAAAPPPPAGSPATAGNADSGHHRADPPQTVRDELPGPVFRTAGRAGALLWSGFSALLAYATVRTGTDLSVSGETAAVFMLAVFLLLLSAVLSLANALIPAIRLKINPDGIRVSRMGLHRDIPWSRVGRVGLVGSGKKQALAVWVPPSSLPESRWWHRVREYHGGSRIFTIGASGGWWKRRREARRLRAALQQYAPSRYDPRLL